MTEVSSQGYVKKQLQLADEALNDARYLFQDGRFNSVANRAYYAMFHAAQAALAAAGAEPPGTHLGVMSLFNKEYVRSGKMDRRFGKDLRDTFDLRQRSDYGPAGVTRREAREATEKADKFLNEVKKLAGI